MNFDLTTIVLVALAAALGILYFVRRSSRMKRAHRKL